MCSLPSSQSDFVLENTQACDKLTNFKPVQPSGLVSFSKGINKNSANEAQKSLPQDKMSEQPTSFEPSNSSTDPL